MSQGQSASVVFVTVFVALLLAGWGIGRLGGFFAHSARAALVAVLLLPPLLMFVLTLDFDPFRQGARTVARQKGPMILWAAVLLALTAFLGHADRRNLLTFADTPALRYAGLALALAGTAVRLAALRVLGRQFSGFVTVQRDHRLVQEGMYRHIRHPMYLGGLLAWVGICLVFRSWPVVPLVALAALVLSKRIRQEEQLLAEHFGAEFEAYRRRTWRLVPHLF